RNQLFNGDLAGTVILTAGLGGLGGANPIATNMNYGVVLCVDGDQTRLGNRIVSTSCAVNAAALDEALKLAEEAKERGEGLSI
ncbi:hypothetical protein FE68_15105, partial [Staphylococcus aureus]